MPAIKSVKAKLVTRKITFLLQGEITPERKLLLAIITNAVYDLFADNSGTPSAISFFSSDWFKDTCYLLDITPEGVNRIISTIYFSTDNTFKKAS